MVPGHILPRTTSPLTLVALIMSSTRIALAALAFAVISLAATDLPAQAGTSARINSSSLGCGPLPTATTSGTSTSAFAGVNHSMNGCSVSASSYAYLGVIGARARAGRADIRLLVGQGRRREVAGDPARQRLGDR